MAFAKKKLIKGKKASATSEAAPKKKSAPPPPKKMFEVSKKVKFKAPADFKACSVQIIVKAGKDGLPSGIKVIHIRGNPDIATPDKKFDLLKTDPQSLANIALRFGGPLFAQSYKRRILPPGGGLIILAKFINSSVNGLKGSMRSMSVFNAEGQKKAIPNDNKLWRVQRSKVRRGLAIIGASLARYQQPPSPAEIRAAEREAANSEREAEKAEKKQASADKRAARIEKQAERLNKAKKAKK